MPLSPEDLRFNPPDFDRAVLESAAADLFGIHGELVPLVGERDQNTLITTSGAEYLMPWDVSNGLLDSEEAHFQKGPG